MNSRDVCPLFARIYCVCVCVYVCLISSPPVFQMEFDEKELRKEISYAIKNIHGIRHVRLSTYSSVLPHLTSLDLSLSISTPVLKAAALWAKTS